mmetsp:Transcript_25392/g.60393  ORF Transcript_25392/g.60393 Transcript_25392/m.60393 type:complete len:208 (-) Transcript_25392:852-1475(-)
MSDRRRILAEEEEREALPSSTAAASAVSASDSVDRGHDVMSDNAVAEYVHEAVEVVVVHPMPRIEQSVDAAVVALEDLLLGPGPSEGALFRPDKVYVEAGRPLHYDRPKVCLLVRLVHLRDALDVKRPVQEAPVVRGGAEVGRDPLRDRVGEALRGEELEERLAAAERHRHLAQLVDEALGVVGGVLRADIPGEGVEHPHLGGSGQP